MKQIKVTPWWADLYWPLILTLTFFVDFKFCLDFDVSNWFWLFCSWLWLLQLTLTSTIDFNFLLLTLTATDLDTWCLLPWMYKIKHTQQHKQPLDKWTHCELNAYFDNLLHNLLNIVTVNWMRMFDKWTSKRLILYLKLTTFNLTLMRSQ